MSQELSSAAVVIGALTVNVLQKTACLVINPITVGSYAFRSLISDLRHLYMRGLVCLFDSLHPINNISAI